MTSLSPAGKENRPQVNNRHPTAPSVMTVNGHFASVGETATKEQFDHGIQIINEDQDFKSVALSKAIWLNSHTNPCLP